MTNWDFHHACLKNVFLNNKETQKPDSAVFAELNRQVMKNNLTLTNCGLVISMFVFPPSFSHRGLQTLLSLAAGGLLLNYIYERNH